MKKNKTKNNHLNLSTVEKRSDGWWINYKSGEAGPYKTEQLAYHLSNPDDTCMWRKTKTDLPPVDSAVLVFVPDEPFSEDGYFEIKRGEELHRRPTLNEHWCLLPFPPDAQEYENFIDASDEYT